MRGIVLALALGCSCAHDGHVSVRVFDTRAERTPVLEDACAIWDLVCVEISPREKSYGSVTIILTDRGAPTELDEDGDDTSADPNAMLTNGWAKHGGCDPVMFSVGAPTTIAHELGHVLGNLEDRQTGAQNVMGEDASSAFRTQAQLERVHRGAARLAVCAGGE